MRPLFRLRWGRVARVVAARDGVQELEVEAEGGVRKALNYPALTGEVAAGDSVLLNTTAVHLGLGSGGFDFVALVAGREEHDNPQKGHIMKLRYTPWQIQVQSAEEKEGMLRPELAPGEAPGVLGGAPVVVGSLHSQVTPSVLAAHAAFALSMRSKHSAAEGVPLKGHAPRLVYVMTDGGALPAWFSSQVSFLRQAGYLSAVITAGHSFGGDAEAVCVYSALEAAVTVFGADLVCVAMGPGIAGTATALGFSGSEQAWILDAVSALGGRPIAIARLSRADRRGRHQGLSHHTATVLGSLVRSPAVLPLPALPPQRLRPVLGRLRFSGILQRHQVCFVPLQPLWRILRESPVPLRTMGRGLMADPDFFLAGAAAGWFAGRLAALIKLKGEGRAGG